jgi:hypothetical protein
LRFKVASAAFLLAAVQAASASAQAPRAGAQGTIAPFAPTDPSPAQNGTPPGQPAPVPVPNVQQRADAEMPSRFRRAQAATPPYQARPVSVEAASTSAATVNRVQVEQPPPQPQQQQRRPTQTPTAVEQLVQRSHDSVDFFDLVDDMIDEMARQLGREDPNLLSPMAVRLVRLSANLRPEFASALEARLVARVVNATSVRMMVCAECTALRSRVENGSWMVTVGAVRQDDLRRLGDTTGVKTFLDLNFTYGSGSNVVWMEATVFRASDGGIVWTDSYRSDGTMAMLLRTGHRIPSRAERSAELEQKMSARPAYGYAVALGVAQMGYAAPTGNITGATASLRFHERFGDDMASLFGLQAGMFTTGPPSKDKHPEALNTIMLGAYFSHNLSDPNLNHPEIWFYGEGGGMFSGNQGNTFYLAGGLDVHLKWRLSLAGGLMYMFPTKFGGYDLGGTGFQLRAGMNW